MEPEHKGGYFIFCFFRGSRGRHPDRRRSTYRNFEKDSSAPGQSNSGRMGKVMQIKFARPRSMKDQITHYCPGCGHGIIHRLICELVDELGIREELIGVCPVGCSVTAYDYFDFDMVEAAHGRAPAVATGIKRVHPDRLVFTYQGDGDLASIGMAEIIHAAVRGEAFNVVFVNNAIYGMTGGQMAPTTLLDQKTTTTPFGRDAENEGYPLRVPELLASLPGAGYLERGAVNLSLIHI